MNGSVIAFPLARRRDLVVRQAIRFLELGPQTAEAYLARQLQVQRETLTRKGVDATAVDAETMALEGAIRAEVWRLVLTPGIGA